jgi:hypothetical protein
MPPIIGTSLSFRPDESWHRESRLLAASLTSFLATLPSFGHASASPRTTRRQPSNSSPELASGELPVGRGRQHHRRPSRWQRSGASVRDSARPLQRVAGRRRSGGPSRAAHPARSRCQRWRGRTARPFGRRRPAMGRRIDGALVCAPTIGPRHGVHRLGGPGVSPAESPCRGAPLLVVQGARPLAAGGNGRATHGGWCVGWVGTARVSSPVGGWDRRGKERAWWRM